MPAGPESVSGPALVPAAQGSVADLEAIQPGGEVRLGGLAFAYKSTRLHPDSLPRLKQVAQAMRDKPELRVHVGGHTDSVGSDAYNLRMSADRAEAVKTYLTEQGIAAERVATRGYGEGRPVADNATEAGRAANRRVVLRFHLPGEDPDGAAPAGGGAPGVWTVNLGEFLLDGLGVRYGDAGFAAPLGLEVANVKVGFQASAQAGAGAPQARVEGLGVDLSGLRLTSAALSQPVLVMGGVSLVDGRLDLAAREAGVARLALINGRVEAERDAQGRIPLAQAFKPAAPATAPASAANAADPGTEPWKFRLDSLELTGFEVALRDRTTTPAAGLTLQRIQASLTGLSQDLGASLPVKLSLAVKEGGSFQAEGKVVPARAAADIRLRLGNLSLKPVQPYISQAARLTLASGSASGAGRVKFDKQLQFDGGFQVANLLLNESEGGARFLAWKQLASESVSYRPEALDIEELKLDGLGAKLVIDQDKTVNLKKILRDTSPTHPPSSSPLEGGSAARLSPQMGGAAPPPHPGRSAAPPPLQGEGGGGDGVKPPATRMTIDRIRVVNGELDFADLSLALPFGTRIHKFQGAFNGISTQPGSAAQLELDGQVDEFGLARAVGQLDLFDPTAFMDIKVVFRNVEMTSLTPYTATFVGRKIDSGKLSLDLEYKIKERQLLGENQIIMDQLTLGERVESPTAKDLPLDLAIAILQDSDGRIDLGLPVSGSLDDPQFSYGRIIWKAIGNILTKIVTAPFRALASLFGGSGEKLEKIAFEAGETGLTPPEREKLKQIATVLNKRPKLALTVHPAWSADLDRPVVKETRLRRAVAETMGVKLGADEEPGPVSTATPKVQAALEALYARHFGAEAMKTLRTRWIQANPEKKQESGAGKLMSRLKGLLKKEEPLSEADMTALKGSDLHALLYERLLAREQVTDDDLKHLARRRGEAIADGLAGAGAPAARIRLGEAEPYTLEGREVPARMELGVAR
jgi:outer membrane protein OmpA-like peptidoglycan-associated protein